MAGLPRSKEEDGRGKEVVERLKVAKVSFIHAFRRWHRLTVQECTLLDCEKERNCGAVLLWEALDHLCGLAVESCMKALLIHAKWVTPDHNGDYPKPDTGPRPHADELWDDFIVKATGRRGNSWVKTLAGGKGTPVASFADWRVDHRYAADGHVSENTARARLKLFTGFTKIAQEEGIL